MENHHFNGYIDPTISMAIFHSYVKLPEGKSHTIPLNQHFPVVFLWFWDAPPLHRASDLCTGPGVAQTQRAHLGQLHGAIFLAGGRDRLSMGLFWGFYM